ncbi:hypothetical protein [Ectothiorhodospira lacustris]|uniref:hypothetical protein n=1 Tax=Ectothiorhodospira lacustris TaxID=2899127 RepID=UPI001EE7A057|nr:hypothetical protein [Ectothiorhodospira lacustris]MCG5499390.1 hypothetical protein [Ectothiorhodospira lacustris]MCG5511305.1 hypothetical protein [Ectothiorhodospira lacustris]MCG5523033.1 hypothetical protein [Ectothiorhodospira lacustris]
MFKKILLTLSVAIPFFGLAFLLTGSPPRTHYDDLPWDVEVHADGTSSVFGIHLEQTPLSDLRERFMAFPSLALFQTREDGKSLEAYFGPVKLGPFEANFLAVLVADEEILSGFAERAVHGKATPSGARRLELSESDTRAALALPVAEITYVPRARYDEESVLARFGEPYQRLPMDDGRRYWLYPEQGLVLMFNRRGRDVLHYVAPARFDEAQGRILAGEGLDRLQP